MNFVGLFRDYKSITLMFYNTDIKPGDSVTKWIKVKNEYYDQTKPIAVEAINYPNPVPGDDLSRALDIIIQKEGLDLYGGSSLTGTKTLYDFYLDGETYLSDIGPEETIQYDFTVSFPSEKENEWQEKTTGFDILIGFQGEGTPTSPPGGGPGGGGLPPGLTILDESVHTTTTANCEVIITWTTNYFSTSQAIYAPEGESHTLDLSDYTGTPPKYGYAYTSPEYHTSPKVTAHTVTVSGLTSLTKYYFRAVSHASPATISKQYTFTTGSCSELYPEEEPSGEEEVPGGEEPPAEIPPAEEGGEIVIGPGPGEEIPPAGEGVSDGEPSFAEAMAGEGETGDEEEEPTGLLGSLLASIGDAFGKFAKKCYSCLPWWLILIFVLYPLYKLVIAKEETRINQKEKIALMGWMSFLVALALYCYFTNYICVQVWVFLILALITILLRHFFFSELTGFKNNFSLILGSLIILILFIVLLIIGCLPLWLLLLLLVVYFFVPDFFRRRGIKREGPVGYTGIRPI